jgi:hypothetical protein
MPNLTFEEIDKIKKNKKFEKTCLRRIETTMNYEKDPNIQRQIEESGKAICKCMSERSANPGVIHRVMVAATRAIPTYTTERQEKKKIAWSGNSEKTQVSNELRTYVMRTFGIEIKKPELTEEDRILLCKMQESKRIAELQRGRIRKPTDFEVDEEFSMLCSKQFE